MLGHDGQRNSTVSVVRVPPAHQRETAGPATPATAFQKVSPTSPNNDGYNSLGGTAVLRRFTTWDYLSPPGTLGPISSGYSGYGQAFDRQRFQIGRASCRERV